VFGYAFGITLTMAITFSVLPALRARKASLLQSAGTGVTQAGRMRFNLVLLTAQIALSAVLLTTASLLGRAVAHATEGNAGWQVRGLTVATWRPEEGQARQDIRGLRQRLAENLDAAELPPWAFMDVLPFLSVSTAQVHVAGSTKGQARQLDLIPVSSSAFSVLGIRLREGRPFSDDRVDEAVLNAAAARLLWPDDSAVGKSLAFRDRTYLVTGVSDDVYLATRWTIKPSLHIPAGTMSSAPAIVVRGDGQGLSDRLKSIVRGVDPDATVSVSTLSDRIGGRLKDEKAGARAAWIGGLLALLLTTLGAFGIFSFLAQQRRREIGIRVALGASRTQILNALFRPVRIAILAGAGIGLVSSLSVAPALDRMLLGLSPFDPIAFAIVVGILTSAAMLATYLPARRALAVEPADVLRDEG
jgi:hypothetical protein